MHLHGSADESLQQGVMQFLRNPRPFRQPLLKANIELAGQMAENQRSSAMLAEIKTRSILTIGNADDSPRMCRISELMTFVSE
jgi:hypothetical protein